MRLQLSGRPPAASDVAGVLIAAAGTLGQRPAITGLLPDVAGGDAGAGGRREQGFASLAGWVAKGANLLHGELGLGAGDRLALAGPPGWPTAAVALSAWWLGLTVVPVPVGHGAGHVTDDATPDVVVMHRALVGDRAADAALDHAVPLLLFGDALDGSGRTSADDVVPSGGEQWTDAVIPHGDRPPPPAHDGDLVALITLEGALLTQRALLTGLDDGGGVLGMLREADEDLLTAPGGAQRLAALALRPLVTGAATVVIHRDDPDRDRLARAERVARWDH